MENNKSKITFKVVSIILALLMLVGIPFVIDSSIHQPSVVAASSEKTSLKDTTLPSIHVIGTGGTIAGQSKDETSFQDYRAGALDIQKDMVDKLPNLDKMANVSTTQFGNKGSSGYSMKDLYDLSLLVDQQLEHHEGVVVTTGTDTMEEIAYFLDLTVRSSKPVVVTGSMRPWTVISNDAQANLFNAIKLAASGKTDRFGTVVMLNDEIFAARNVTKTNSYRLDTFDSPQLGMLGYIDQDNIRIYQGTPRTYKNGKQWATPFDLRKISQEDLPKVEVVYSYQDAGGEAIDAFVDGGAKGIVTAGTGAGGVSSEQRKAMSQAIEKGTIFLKTTRTGSGSVYGGGKGIIPADNLKPQHARILLLLSLAFSDNYDTIATWVKKYGALQEVDPETQEPELVIDKPEDRWKTNRETVTVEGTATGENLDWVKVNNQKANLSEDGTYSKRIMLENGENVIKVVAKDTADNRTQKKVTVFAKFAAPSIDNLGPTEDMHIESGESVKIEMDSEPGLHPTFAIKMPLTHNAKQAKLSRMTELPMMETENGHYVGYWTAIKGLKAKGAEIEVTVNDNYGNTSREKANGKLHINVGEK